MVDPDLALALCRAYNLRLGALQAIRQHGLLPAQIPDLKNMKDLYRCYQQFGKPIWAEADKFAAKTIPLPPGAAVPKANALHLVAGLPQADKIRQLADVGSLLALWFIEDMAYWVTVDAENNEEEPERGEFAAIWAPVAKEEEMHTITGYDEALVRKLNRLLEA